MIKLLADEWARKLDEQIKNARSAVDLWSTLSPENADEQKRKFLEGEIENPDLKYKRPEGLEEHKRNLETIHIPHSVSSWVKDLYRDTVEQYLGWIEIAEKVGRDPSRIRELTIDSFGKPVEEDDDFNIVDIAEDILLNGYDLENEFEGSGEVFEGEEMRESIREALRQEGIDWVVENTDKGSVRVEPADKKIEVPDRDYSENDFHRLPLHEVGIHGFRAANGFEQPYGILGVGTEGYSKIEEGITSTVEEVTGLLNSETVRKYAERVIAVQSVLDDYDFGETFEMLQDYGIDEDKAWKRSVRAHRGGGCIKDHVYLKGKKKVERYLENGGRLRYQMVGSMRFHYQKEVEDLMDKNVLKSPKYNPALLLEGERKERLEEIW